uniref:Uncharacterized protein n=1 Tax=Oryza barthii TaxID=65489 RepID=A0A0D3F4L5_9ORYZ
MDYVLRPQAMRRWNGMAGWCRCVSKVQWLSREGLMAIDRVGVDGFGQNVFADGRRSRTHVLVMLCGTRGWAGGCGLVQGGKGARLSRERMVEPGLGQIEVRGTHIARHVFDELPKRAECGEEERG